MSLALGVDDLEVHARAIEELVRIAVPRVRGAGCNSPRSSPSSLTCPRGSTEGRLARTS
jgi:hypothetical protein